MLIPATAYYYAVATLLQRSPAKIPQAKARNWEMTIEGFISDDKKKGANAEETSSASRLEEALVPAPGHRFDASPQTKSKENDDQLAQACAIVLKEEEPTGVSGAVLRSKYQADKTMSEALTSFVNSGFEIVDTDKNGTLSESELKKATSTMPSEVRPEVLKFLNKNQDSLHSLCDDVFGIDYELSKKDINKYADGTENRYNESLSEGFAKGLQNEDVRGLESVVKNLSDRQPLAESILKNSKDFMPGSGDRKLEISVSKVNDLLTVKVEHENSARLYVSNDSGIVPTYAEKNKNYYGVKWAPSTIDFALSKIGHQARTNPSR